MIPLPSPVWGVCLHDTLCSNSEPGQTTLFTFMLMDSPAGVSQPTDPLFRSPWTGEVGECVMVSLQMLWCGLNSSPLLAMLEHPLPWQPLLHLCQTLLDHALSSFSVHSLKTGLEWRWLMERWKDALFAGLAPPAHPSSWFSIYKLWEIRCSSVTILETHVALS